MERDWIIDSLANCAHEHGVELSNALLGDMADAVGALEEYSSYGSHDTGVESELTKVERELEREKSKRVCGKCSGKGGWNESVGSAHYSWERCPHCDGKGWVY